MVNHTDGQREYAYDRDPVLGSGTKQLHSAATENKWTVIDMAADWATRPSTGMTRHPPVRTRSPGSAVRPQARLCALPFAGKRHEHE